MEAFFGAGMYYVGADRPLQGRLHGNHRHEEDEEADVRGHND